MAYGIQLFADDGITITWDSTKVGSGVIVGIITVPAYTSPVYTYPDFPGRTLFRVTMALSDYFYAGGSGIPSIDYTLGYPRISFPSVGMTTTNILAIE